MESDDEDITPETYALLRSVLQPRTKELTQEVVADLLFGRPSDKKRNKDEAAVAKIVTQLASELLCSTYKLLKQLSKKQLDNFIEEKTKNKFVPGLALDLLSKLHKLLKTKIPAPEESPLNSISESESITMAASPWNVKLADPESSINRGLVDVSVTEAPCFVTPHKTGTEMLKFHAENGITDLASMFTEGTYTMKVIGSPPCMEAKAADAVARTVMPENYRGGRKRFKSVQAHPNSKPELSAGVRSQFQFCVTKSDEMKSFPSEGVEELIQTGLGHTQSSFFREDEGGESFRFFENPPWTMAFLPCGPSVIVIFAAEMIGMPLYSIYAGGCSFGTKQYEDHKAFLESIKKQYPVVDLKDTPLTECEHVGKKVRWTTENVNGKFYKMNEWDLYQQYRCPEHGIARGDNWRRLFRVYDKYYKAFHGSVNVPDALVPARLLYGHYRVVVELDFIDSLGPAVTDRWSEQDGKDLRDALFFLATHGLVYSDFRPPNIIRCAEDNRIRLIDYDDMKIVEPSASVLRAQYEAILAKLAAGHGFEAWVRGAIVSMLELYPTAGEAGTYDFFGEMDGSLPEKDNGGEDDGGKKRKAKA